ncbi:hypothetical protein Aduo_001811 [Ancylostoma duodenale]
MSVPVQDTMHVILGCIRIVVSAVAGREAPSTDEEVRPATWQPPGDSNEEARIRLPSRQLPGYFYQEEAGFRVILTLHSF